MATDLPAKFRAMAARMETEAQESREDGDEQDAHTAEGAAGAFLMAARMAEKDCQ